MHRLTGGPAIVRGCAVSRPAVLSNWTMTQERSPQSRRAREGVTDGRQLLKLGVITYRAGRIRFLGPSHSENSL